MHQSLLPFKAGSPDNVTADLRVVGTTTNCVDSDCMLLRLGQLAEQVDFGLIVRCSIHAKEIVEPNLRFRELFSRANDMSIFAFSVHILSFAFRSFATAPRIMGLRFADHKSPIDRRDLVFF